MSFPAIVIYVLLAIAFLGILVGIWATRIHYKKGGLNHNETVILFKEGPYRAMRPPAVLCMMLPILLPIILSPIIPFIILSVAFIIMIIVYVYYRYCLEEKKLDLPKWSDEYRQYMKEVTRCNFVLGIWRLRLKKKR
jgi:protein-S-isoprenylcysteine O-methyltransferase Ste14